MDVKAVTEMIENYIRPATFPVGIKMLKPGEALPPKTRTPGDMGSRFATCQTINVVRRYGWSIGLSADHHSCPLGLVALGSSRMSSISKKGMPVRECIPRR